MSLKYGVMVANVTEDTELFWIKFKQTCRDRGIKYTQALEQAASMWMERSEPAAFVNPFANPSPIPGDDE